MERFFNSKWIATAASILIQCGTGASYTFGIYSSVLKSSQSYDQSTLDTVSVFKDIGANVGILPGLLYATLTNPRSRIKTGPWVVHMVGAMQCFVGYFLMWASVVGLISPPPVAVMCLFMFVASHALTFFNTANVVSGVENFRDYGGTIVGIMKGFLGLSGAILIQAYNVLCHGKPSNFLLLLAIGPTLVTLSAMPFVRIYRTATPDDKKYLNSFSAVALTVAAYLMLIIILENIFILPFWARTVTFTLLLILVASPVGIAIKALKEQDPDTKRTKDPLEYYHEIPSEPNQTKAGSTSSSGVDLRDNIEEEDINGDEFEDVNALQAMVTVNFWLLFIAMVCGMGSGLATINNISQIGESLGYTSKERSSLVTLWSIWNFLGRFGAGYISDAFLHKLGWSRPSFLVITLATLTLGHLTIASGFPGCLYIGSVVVGICYGSFWSLMPTITSEIFGVRHMGTIYNTIGAASPVGSYIFSVRVIGYLYDKVAEGETHLCYGKRCFMMSFIIMASVAFFGGLVALALFFRTRRFYRKVVVKRLKRYSKS